MELMTVTVRTASRQRVGQHAYHEIGVSLTYAVRGEGPKELEAVVSQAGTALEQAFQQLWKRLDEGEEHRAS